MWLDTLVLAQISAYCGKDLDVAVLNVPCTTVYIPGNAWNIYFMERLNWREAELKYQGTRMHSSRMRTIRSSSHVYPSMHWAGGVYPSMHWAGGVCPEGCLPGEGVYPGVCVCPGGVCLGRVPAQGGVSARGGVSHHALKQTPPPLWKNITFPQLRLRTVMTSHFGVVSR